MLRARVPPHNVPDPLLGPSEPLADLAVAERRISLLRRNDLRGGLAVVAPDPTSRRGIRDHVPYQRDTILAPRYLWFP